MPKVKEQDLELAPVAIEYLREVKGWSYRDIGKRLRCSQTTVYRAHTQGSIPLRHTAEALSKLAKRIWRQKNGA